MPKKYKISKEWTLNDSGITNQLESQTVDIEKEANVLIKELEFIHIRNE